MRKVAAKKKTEMLKTGVSELLAKQPSTEAEKDACIRELQGAVKEMAAELTERKEMVLWLRRQMYGSKSEQTPAKEEKQLGMHGTSNLTWRIT